MDTWITWRCICKYTVYLTKLTFSIHCRKINLSFWHAWFYKHRISNHHAFYTMSSCIWEDFCEPHDGVMTWKRFPHYRPFTRSPGQQWILLIKDQFTTVVFFVVVNANKLLNQQPSCRWFGDAMTLMSLCYVSNKVHSMKQSFVSVFHAFFLYKTIGVVVLFAHIVPSCISAVKKHWRLLKSTDIIYRQTFDIRRTFVGYSILITLM